MRIKWKK
jgi:hypothetical protein